MTIATAAVRTFTTAAAVAAALADYEAAAKAASADRTSRDAMYLDRATWFYYFEVLANYPRPAIRTAPTAYHVDTTTIATGDLFEAHGAVYEVIGKPAWGGAWQACTVRVRALTGNVNTRAGDEFSAYLYARPSV